MTLDESAGIDLYEISPHSSDNSHTELYETMFSEYALGTARFAASKNNGGVSAYRQFEEMQKIKDLYFLYILTLQSFLFKGSSILFLIIFKTVDVFLKTSSSLIENCLAISLVGIF